MDSKDSGAPAPGAELAMAALEESRLRKERRESLRRAKSSSKSQAELDQELWRAAESGTFERVSALLAAGAGPSWRERVDSTMSVAPKNRSAMATAGPMQRAAWLGNENFLRAALEAGLDPFEDVAAWEEILESDEASRFGATNPKQARWLESACAAGLSAHGAQVVQAWARGSGASMAGSPMNKMAWRPAIALARRAGASPAAAFQALARMLGRWDHWSRDKEGGDAMPMELAQAMSRRSVEAASGLAEPMWSEAIRGHAGASAALALSALGGPPAAIGWTRLSANWGGAAKAPAGSHSTLLAALCCNAMEMFSILARVPGMAEGAQAASAEARAWAWVQCATLRQAKELRALGMDLAELDALAVSSGAAAHPKLLGWVLKDRSEPLDLALSVGRLDTRLWFSKGGDGADGWSALAKVEPAKAAKIESQAIRKEAPPVASKDSSGGSKRL